MESKNLRCPMDGSALEKNARGLVCSHCNTQFPLVEVEPGRFVPDLRCNGRSKPVKMEFDIPQTLLTPEDVKKFGHATRADFQSLSREEVRKKFGTKLHKETMYYIQKTYDEKGPQAAILDLGCGQGGSKRYMQSAGFENVLAVDYYAAGSEYLVDAHCLPFEDSTFDMILTTATIEHFYNPFIAFAEMSRVLKPDGDLIASASFWESWHGQSCFHFTPNGWLLLCRSADFKLEDLWSEWGFISSISSHALNLGRFKRFTYFLQEIFDNTLSIFVGQEAVVKHRMRTSGSFGIYATNKKNGNGEAQQEI